MYTIKGNKLGIVGKAKLVNDEGKTVASGKDIKLYAPEISNLKDANIAPIYIIKDKDEEGNAIYKFYSEQTGFLYSKHVEALNEDVFSNNGSPLMFTKYGKAIYVDPRTTNTYEIKGSDKLCFAVSKDGKISHEGAFIVRDGMPIALEDEKLNEKIPQQIITFPDAKVMSNVYEPLLCRNANDVISYLGCHRDLDYKELVKNYEELHGPEKTNIFIKSFIQSFKTLVDSDEETQSNFGPEYAARIKNETLNLVGQVEEYCQKINPAPTDGQNIAEDNSASQITTEGIESPISEIESRPALSNKNDDCALNK